MKTQAGFSLKPKYILTFLAWLLFCSLILSPTGVPAATGSSETLSGEPEKASAPERLTILHLNDYHGHWEPFIPQGQHQPLGGFARIAEKIEDIYEHNYLRFIPTLVLEAGDILQGTVQSSVFRGEADMALRNPLWWTASAVGNHEFDYGLANLINLAAQAKFPFLAANIAGLDNPPWKPYIIIKEGDLRIAVFGLTTADTPFTTHPKNVKGLKFLDPIPRARELIKELKPQADLIIALTHIGYDLDKRLAREVPGINVIVGGHSHTRMTTPTLIGSTIIVTAFEYGEFLGRLELNLKNKQVTGHTWELIPITPDIPEHKKTAALIAQYRAKLDKRLTEAVGWAKVDLLGTREAVRRKETNLGDLVADAIREATGTEIALVNGGSIRQGILAGPITLMDVISVLPFDDTIVTLKLTGQQIEQALNRSVKLSPDEGGFLQVSGLKFKVEKGRAADIMVNGKPLTPGQTYKVAMSDFLAAGGDGFVIFLQGKDYYNTGLLPREAFIAYIKPRGTLEGATDTRIIFLDEKR